MSQPAQAQVPDCPVPQQWPSLALGFKDPRLIVLVVSCLISSVQGIDPTLHAIAMPAVASDFLTPAGGGPIDQSMVGILRSIGTIVLAASMLGVGIIGDANGRKKIMILGAFGMGLSAILSAFSPSAMVFGASRVAMGLTTAMSFGMALAFVPSLYHKHELPKAFATWLAIQSAMVVGSTIIAGPIMSQFGWKGLYVFTAAIVIVSGFAAIFVLPENKAETVRKFDTGGVILAAIALILLVYALGQATTRGFGHPIVWGGTLGGIVLLGVFGFYESKQKEPGFPIQLFKIPAFTAACLAGIMFNFANGSILGQSNAILGALRDAGTATSPIVITLLSALLGVGMFVGSVMAGPAMSKFKMTPRAMFVSGMIILAAGLISQMAFTVDNRVIIIGLGMFLVGHGVMWTQAPQSSVIMGSAPKDLVGSVGSVKPAVGQMGFGFGFGVSMPIASLFMDASGEFTVNAYKYGLAVSAGIMVLFAVIMFFLMAGHGQES